MQHADPDLTPAGIATRLEQMRERIPLGNVKWFPSTVRLLLQRAERMGMISDLSLGSTLRLDAGTTRSYSRSKGDDHDCQIFDFP